MTASPMFPTPTTPTVMSRSSLPRTLRNLKSRSFAELTVSLASRISININITV